MTRILDYLSITNNDIFVMERDFMNNYDIDPILSDWTDKGGARKIVGADGVHKVQMRVEVNGHRGILQFNSDGRPDGERPHGCEYALEYFVEQVTNKIKEGTPSEMVRLSEEESTELAAEAMIIYQRYIVLLQLEDYDRVVRDTEHNMQAFRFLNNHAHKSEEAESLTRWWPYIIRIHRTAIALKAADAGDFDTAVGQVREAEREIAALSDMDDEIFILERNRSIEVLDEMVENFLSRTRPGRLQLLKARQFRAIEREDYEAAARYRDRISKLKAKLEETEDGEEEIGQEKREENNKE